jgi:transposase
VTHNYCLSFRDLQTEDDRIKLLTEYESVTQEVVFGNTVLVALISGMKYDVITQNFGCSRERQCAYFRFFETKTVIKTQRRYRTQNWIDPPSENAVRRWIKQFQETGSVLYRNVEGRPSTSQKDADWIQKDWPSYVTCWSFLALCSIDSRNKTFWVTFSYSVSSFILLFSVWR